MANFNTLEQAENLQQCGFSENEAKGIVQVITLSQLNLATKRDLKELSLTTKRDIRALQLATKRDLKQFKKEFKLEIQLEIQKEIHKEIAPFKEEFTAFKQETRLEFTSVREEMRLGFANLDNKILKMTISLGSVTVVALGGYTYLLNWMI